MGWYKNSDGQLSFSENAKDWPPYIKGGIEIRCPGKFKKLFLVLKQEHLPSTGTFMEIACADCAKEAKAAGVGKLKRALHYYDGLGNCVTTKIVFDDNTAD